MTPRDPDVLGIMSEGARRREHFGRHAFAYGLAPASHTRAVERKIRARRNAILDEEIEREAREQAAAIMADIRSLERRRIPLKQVIGVALEITGSTWDDTIGGSRAASSVAPRQFCWWLVRTLQPGISLETLGRIFHRDRTTIRQGLRQMQRKAERAPFVHWRGDPRLAPLFSRAKGDER
jgi:chromosomal replication initiation ATPase DnaA